MWIIIITIVLLLMYIFIFTPYPFVWLLRSKKEEQTEKEPENIDEIKAGLIIKTNLPYPSAYPQSTFDFYYDPHQPVQHVIVWVHGGAFIAGSSIGMRNFGPMLAKQGYAVCAMNYAYAPRYSFPVQIRQVDEMLCYTKDYLQKEYQIDLVGAFLGGDSAGANIVASYATMYKNNQLATKSQIELRNSLPIQGLLLFCGPYDFTEDLQRDEFKQLKTFLKYIGWSYLGHKSWMKRQEKVLASPLINIHSDFPSAYICDGKKFSFMWQGKKLVKVLEEKGIDVKSRFYDDMPHEFQFNFVKYPEESMQVFKESVAFLDRMTGKEEKEC
ncbi:alpha/beta hydrolase [Candidatus Stoquefichus massiliensis]|uniref:alpha/beta hydrolase n=1 Tax=Candidatus Stoquefichus massiliensis TaxID=1470350 RepID=UPI000487C57D|nr:alpha/beta hydrolase [Candidatus Stoquefichus massiliensis]